MMTYEIPELFGLTRLSEQSVSHLADNVVLLKYPRWDRDRRGDQQKLPAGATTVPSHPM